MQIYVKETAKDFESRYRGTPEGIQIAFLDSKTTMYVKETAKDYESRYTGTPQGIQVGPIENGVSLQVIKDKTNPKFENINVNQVYNVKIENQGGKKTVQVIKDKQNPNYETVYDQPFYTLKIDFLTTNSEVSSRTITGVPDLPDGAQIDDSKIATLEIDDNFINSYGSKTAKSGSKYYPRTQWSIPAFENEEIHIVFNTPLVGDTASSKDKKDLKEDVDPEWENTQTIGFKMDPDHEKNADMYKVGVSIGKYLVDDIFHREYDDKEYTKTKPGDSGIVMHNKIVIPRGQEFAVLIRHWNIDSKDSGKADGVHIEAFVDPKNDGNWLKYLEVDDVGQFDNNLDPIINPKFKQKVQTRLDEAKPHWEKNIVMSKIRPITFNGGKDFIKWKPSTLKSGDN